MEPEKYAHSALLCLSRWLRGLGILTLTALVFPFAVAVCLPCLLLAQASRAIGARPADTDSDAKCVLILAGAKGKALHLAGLFKAEGYRTVVAESEMYRYPGASVSNRVDAFRYLPAADRNPQGYVAAVLAVVKEHSPDLFVPLDPRTVDLDLQVISLLPKSCFPLVCEAEAFRELDDKSSFMAALERAGIGAPRTQLVRSKREAYDFLKGRSQHFVFKPVVYDNVGRANIFPPRDSEELERYLADSGVSKTKPYVIQERLVGPEMASVSLVVKGEILAQSVGFSSPVHQTQDQVRCPEVEAWVDSFVRLYPRDLVGWFTVDYMKSPLDGQYYPLECNPRLGTNFMLFTERQGIIPRLQAAVDKARASAGSGKSTVSQRPSGTPDRAKSSTGASKTSEKASPPDTKTGIPAPSTQGIITPERQQLYYLMNVLWVLVSSPCSPAVWREYLAIWWRGTEAVFSVWDPLPFLALNFLHMPLLIVKYLCRNQPWNIADYNIGTLKMV